MSRKRNLIHDQITSLTSCILEHPMTIKFRFKQFAREMLAEQVVQAVTYYLTEHYDLDGRL